MYWVTVVFSSFITIWTIGQIEGDLRLVSNNSSSGRLEIFLNNAWGTVCIDGFDMYEADLACSQLGYLYAVWMGTAQHFG